MDFFTERILPFIKTHFLALIVGGVGLVFLVYGLVSVYYVPEAEDVVFASNTSPASEQKQPKETKKTFLVDVSGAVNKPGVYHLPAGSRVQDAVLAAGGLAANVDQQRVSQMLNLAAPLTDGAKLYIPIFGEEMVTSGNTSAATSQATDTVAGASTSMINLNTASATDLEALPGVGEVTAGKIIENRPYGSIEELLEKKVVGEATFEELKEQVSVY